MHGMAGMSGTMSGTPSATPQASSMMNHKMHTMMDSMTMSGGFMLMSDMAMTFFTSDKTPLYSISWSPETTGQYAGTCIFLIILSLLLRFLYAAKAILEVKWLQAALKRRYVVVSTPDSKSETQITTKEICKGGAVTGTLTTNGFSENVKLVQGENLHLDTIWKRPWRLSVDLPRALLVTVMVGIGYLLMLAVMTMNVGYFLSVLAGAFVGELFFGRYTQSVEAHH